MSKDDVLKLTDFGSVRPFGAKNEQFTQGVITPNYRPLEIFFGATLYGPAVDIWSCGCVFAEMFRGDVLFPGMRETEIIGNIYLIIGSPNSSRETEWPGCVDLPNYLPSTKPISNQSLKKAVGCTDIAYGLLSKMLRHDPNKRITTKQALHDRYFE